jgi:hypothetical protein
LFWYTWHIFNFPITQFKLLSRHILDKENFGACLDTQSYLVLCFLQYLQFFYDLNLSRKFHFITMHKMAMFFFFLFWDSYLQGPKNRLCHIWSYHLDYMSQWPWFRVWHIGFLRYTYLPNLMILEQLVFKLRVGTGFFHIWSNHLTWRSQWPDFKVQHIVYPRCTSWQTLMILGMIVFKLWSRHEVDRQTDTFAITTIRSIIDGA